MAIQGGTVRWVVEADTESFDRSMQRVESDARKTGSELDKTTKNLNGNFAEATRSAIQTSNAINQIGMGLKQLAVGSAQAALGSIGATMTGMVSKGLSLGSTLEGNKLSFKALTGSAESARQVLTAVADFAADNPFQMLDVSNVAKKFVSMSIPAQDVAKHLNTIGKVSVASGASLEGIGHVFSQVAAQGKLMTQDMYQLVNQGVAIMPALSRVTGKTMEELRDDLSKGKVSFELMTKAMNNIVPDDMAKQLQLEMFNTIPRQMDRLKGSISTFATELVGINKKTGDTLKNGLAYSYMEVLKSLANGLRDPKLLKAISDLGIAFAPILQNVAKGIPKLFEGITKATTVLAQNSKLAVPLIAGFGLTIGNLGASLPVVGPILQNFSGGVKQLAGGFLSLAQANPVLAGIIAIFTIGFVNAYKNNEEFRQSIGRLLSSLLSLGVKLTQPLTNVVDILGKLVANQAVTNVLLSVTNALGLLADALNALPTPVLNSLVYGLLGVLAIQKLSNVINPAVQSISVLGQVSKVASPAVSSLGRSLSGGLIKTLQPLSAGLPVIAKASAGIALLGLSIGVAIGSVGGGIWLLGEGLKSLGDSFIHMKKGVDTLSKTNFSAFPSQIKKMVDALSGIQNHIFDLAGAALTFKGIGEGLEAIGVGIKQFRSIDIKDINKLPELAKVLKDFKIDLVSEMFSGNVLNKFKNTGEGIKNVAALLETISKVNIPFEGVKKNLEHLATGLKAFLIAELQPSWLESTFGVGIMKPKSVTDYMNSLGSIIDPLNKLQDTFKGEKFNSDTLKKNLSSLADGLKAFLITEVQPSWLEATFGKTGSIKIASVTNYLQDLGGIVQPISAFSQMVQGKDFKSAELTTFLKNLGDALKAFLIQNITSDLNLFNGMVKRSFKVDTKSVLDYTKNLGAVAEGVKTVISLITSKEGAIDSGKGKQISDFLKSLGNSLKSFTVTDIESETTRFLRDTQKMKTTHKSILEGMQNFKGFVDGIISLSSIFKDGVKIDINGISNIIQNVGNVLKQLTYKNISSSFKGIIGEGSHKESYDNILSKIGDFNNFVNGVKTLVELSKDTNINTDNMGKIMTNMKDFLSKFSVENKTYKNSKFAGDSKETSTSYTNILGNIGNFNDFAKGVKTLVEVSGTNNFNKDNFTLILGSVGGLLQSLTLTTSEFRSKGYFDTSVEDKVGYDSALTHLGDFQNFANGVKIFAEAAALQNFNPENFKTILGSVGNLLETLTLQTTDFKAKGYFDTSEEMKVSYDSALAHVGDFQNFAQGIKVIVDAISIQNFNPGNFSAVLDSIGILLRTTTEKEIESEKDYSILGKVVTKEKMDSVFSHLTDFQNFAQGIKTIAELTTMQNFDVNKFKEVLRNIFDGVKELALKETESVQNGGWFGGGGSEKVNYSSALAKLGDFKGFVQALSNLQQMNVGDGAGLKTLLTNISGGVRELLNINDIDTSTIDTQKISSLAQALGAIKVNTQDWDTSTLAQKGTDFKNFLTQVIEALSTDFSANIEKMSGLGKSLVDNIVNGMNSGLPAITGAAANVQGTIWNTIQPKIQDEYFQGAFLAQKFAEGITSNFPELAQAGRDIQGTIWNAIEPKLQDEYWQGRALGGKFIEGIRSQNAGFEQSGIFAIEGLIRGSDRGLGSLYQAGMRVAQKFLDGVKARANEHSPWRTTYQSGIFAIEGLMNGVESMQENLYDTAWKTTDEVVSIFENMNDVYRPQIVPQVSGVNGTNKLAPVGGYGGNRVIIEQTNNNYTQYSIDQMNRDLEWQLRKV